MKHGKKKAVYRKEHLEGSITRRAVVLARRRTVMLSFKIFFSNVSKFFKER